MPDGHAGRTDHHGARGAKVAYAGHQEAEEASRRRRVEFGVALKAYRCTWVNPRSVHPVLRRPHWHLGNPRTRATDAARAHELWDVALGKRVVGCLNEENFGSPEVRASKVVRRAASCHRRRATGVDRQGATTGR